MKGIYLLGAVLMLPRVQAHEGVDALPDPLIPLTIAAALTLLVLTYTIVRNVEKLSPREKLFCFWLVALPIMLASLYLIVHTLYDTTASATKGPVHWHADYQVWVCGEKLDLINPRFPKNKIGSPLLHEHNDDRIHVEGTVKNLDTITLGRYFAVVGGALTTDILSYPTAKGITTIANGDTCPNSPNPVAIKVLVNGKHVADPASHLLYPAALVPPGDCIIIQVDDSSATTTDKRCTSWEVKGITYDNLNRPTVTIGEETWQ